MFWSLPTAVFDCVSYRKQYYFFCITELVSFPGKNLYLEISRFYNDSCIVLATMQQKFAIEFSILSFV